MNKSQHLSISKKILTITIFSFLLLISANLQATQIHSRGYWLDTNAGQYHFFDTKLVVALGDFFEAEEATSIVDMGCGMGDYIRHFLNMDIDAIGYDGNPHTVMLSNGICKVQDLSVPFNLGKTFDWVLSLEVGEHIPKKYEKIFIENLVRHCKKGLVLSWAVKNQGGHGHFNEQNNDYIKKRIMKYGFENDVEVENYLRSSAAAGWFKNTIMVFRKIEN